MAFKSVAVSVGTVDTDVYEMPATTQGAVVLGIGNVNASARTITLKFYNANLNTTTTIVSGYSIAANTFVKWPKPILMATGDKIIMSSSNSSSIVADAAITDSASAPVATGFTARGVWDNGITYNANDLVWVDDAISTGRGASYIAKVNASPNLNKNPTTETAFWMRYAGDGPAGDLSASDIGVTVQAYDANTSKTNANETFSGIKTFSEVFKLMGAQETVQTSGTGLSGTLNFDQKSYSVYYSTANATGNWTLNVRGDGSTTLNSRMDTGKSITIAVIATQGSTAYYQSAFQIDGASVTPKWIGGAPTAGTTSSVEMYVFTIVKTADATFTVLAQKIAFT